MQMRRKLRFRLTLSFALFGFGLSALFAVSLLHIRSRVENQLVSSSLQQDIDKSVDLAIQNPNEPPHSHLMEAWIRSERTLFKMPMSWQSLGNGVHDIFEAGADGQAHHYKLAVRRKQGIVGFLRYDVSRDDLGRQQLVIAGMSAVFFFSVLSLLLGVWLSRKVLKPVSDLAQRLRAFRKDESAEPLATQFADDEVGELAHALDEYAQRLTAMVKRDREFNSDVSHELRTPLTVISSTVELLQELPDLNNKLLDRLKRIERASRQATELIEALLLLSRAERRGPARGEVTEVTKLVADVIDSQQPQMRNKPLSIEVVADQPLCVIAPGSVLSVVLTNLVGNAVKYTLEGKVTVEIGDSHIEVIDTGPGIKPEDAERLFQRGVRGEGAGGSGAGLGLAIVRRLCDLYGWQVTMRPRAGTNGAIARLDFQAKGAPVLESRPYT